MEDSDVYSPLHGEGQTRKLRFEDSSRSDDGGIRGGETASWNLFGIYGLERLDINQNTMFRNTGRNAVLYSNNMYMYHTAVTCQACAKITIALPRQNKRLNLAHVAAVINIASSIEMPLTLTNLFRGSEQCMGLVKWKPLGLATIQQQQIVANEGRNRTITIPDSQEIAQLH